MSIATAIQAAQAKVAAAYTECNAKGATMPSAANQDLAHLDDTIASIPAGGGSTPVTSKDVNFYDYEGTILYSYTKAEFLALTAMPANPSHQGLTAQGWNWNLTDAKAYVTTYGKLDIGQMYITSDGKTRLYITIAAEGRMTVPLYWSQTVSNSVTVDWGDGSSTQTFSGTGNKNTTHTYSAIGSYVITLAVSSGTLGLGASSSSYCVLGDIRIDGNGYCNMLQKVEVGSSVTSIYSYAFYNCFSLESITIPSNVTSIGNNAFYYCFSLESITIPSNVTSIGDYAFHNCYSLVSVTIPSSVTSIGNNAFYYCFSLESITIPSNVTSIGTAVFNNCYSLESITIPSSVTSIGNTAFRNCYSLESITIPSSVTSIGNYVLSRCYSLESVTIPSNVPSIGNNAFEASTSLVSVTIPSSVTSIGNFAFHNCISAKYYYIYPTTPPTLTNTTVFTNIPSDCIIYVPSDSVSAYKSATNWKTYSNYIQAMP